LGHFKRIELPRVIVTAARLEKRKLHYDSCSLSTHHFPPLNININTLQCSSRAVWEWITMRLLSTTNRIFGSIWSEGKVQKDDYSEYIWWILSLAWAYYHSQAHKQATAPIHQTTRLCNRWPLFGWRA
jgi:hypothetical protein